MKTRAEPGTSELAGYRLSGEHWQDRNKLPDIRWTLAGPEQVTGYPVNIGRTGTSTRISGEHWPDRNKLPDIRWTFAGPEPIIDIWWTLAYRDQYPHIRWTFAGTDQIIRYLVNICRAGTNYHRYLVNIGRTGTSTGPTQPLTCHRLSLRFVVVP